jgi:hypothetical protein
MKLPSLNYLMINAKNSFLRFPLSIISSFIVCVLGIYLTENKNDHLNYFPIVNLMLCFALGIPLYFCVAVLCAKQNFNQKNSIFLYLLASLILILIYFSFPDNDSDSNASLPYVKYIIYNISIHLLVSFIPYVSKHELNGFWNYNKVLFLRFCTSFLYSQVLCLGLFMALFAVDKLFNLNIDAKLYLDIQILVCGLFNTWFFVAGIPENFDSLNEIIDYPKGLKIFSQYILLPLLILYLTILYIYGAKILLFWSWPSGIVSYLIIIVSIIGILTLLLIYPYGNSTENAWIRFISKAYYIILLPLIAILFIAIFMRMNDYGITISRYLILMLGVWISLICIYFITGKTNIKIIPISLAIMFMGISFGPWGMFSVSEKHQIHRLEKILELNNILTNGKINKEFILKIDTAESTIVTTEQTNDSILSDSLNNEVMSIFNYLDNHHGFSSIKTWYKQNIDSIFKSSRLNIEKWGYYRESELYMMALGLPCEYKYKEVQLENASYFEYLTDQNDVTFVKDYDYLISFNLGEPDESEKHSIYSFLIDSTDYKLTYSFKATDTLWLKTKTMSLPIQLKKLALSLKQQYGKNDTTIPNYKMRIDALNEKLKVKCEITYMRFKNTKDTASVSAVSGSLFVKLK